MRSLLLVTLVACAAVLTGCRKHHVVISPPPPPSSPASNTLVDGTLIKSGGAWEHFDGRDRCTLSTTPSAARINWNYRRSGARGNSSTSSSMSLANPSAPWFIYVEAPDHLWFFDGGGHLSYRRWDHGNDTGDAMVKGQLKVAPADVPPGLIPHLPAELQKLFPAVENKPRPSI